MDTIALMSTAPSIPELVVDQISKADEAIELRRKKNASQQHHIRASERIVVRILAISILFLNDVLLSRCNCMGV